MLQAQPAQSTASFSKDDVKLLAIPPSEVGRVWRIAQEQLALAVSWSRKVDLAEMRERLASGFGQLWMVWAPQQERVLCTFVVELIEYPSGWKTARVVLLGDPIGPGRYAEKPFDEQYLDQLRAVPGLAVR